MGRVKGIRVGLGEGIRVVGKGGKVKLSGHV